MTLTEASNLVKEIQKFSYVVPFRVTDLDEYTYRYTLGIRLVRTRITHRIRRYEIYLGRLWQRIKVFDAIVDDDMVVVVNIAKEGEWVEKLVNFNKSQFEPVKKMSEV